MHSIPEFSLQSGNDVGHKSPRDYDKRIVIGWRSALLTDNNVTSGVRINGNSVNCFYYNVST